MTGALLSFPGSPIRALFNRIFSAGETEFFMKTNLAVFFGGASVEHEVSVISAVQAMHVINRDKYNVVPVYIGKDGEMFTGDRLFDMDSYKNLPALLKSCYRVVISREKQGVVLKAADSGIFNRKPRVVLHMAFPIVHGTNCEDGTLAGYFELLGLPYIGCDVLSSAVGMDKTIFKHTLAACNIPVLPCISFYSRRWVAEKEALSAQIAAEIGYPLIVKPANLGSSVGITKVDSPEQLENAVDLACSFAEKLLVEKAIADLREINCSVLGDHDKCEASACEEPVMHDEILSYQDKYMTGSGKSGAKGMGSLSRKLPAALSPGKAEEISRYAKETFLALGCSGVARIDFLMDTADSDKVYVNEINTIPGSLAFYLWEASGLPYAKLIDRLIELGFKRARTRGNLMFTIETNLLSMTSGIGGAKGSKS